MLASLLLFDSAWLAGKAEPTEPSPYEAPPQAALPELSEEESWPTPSTDSEIPAVIGSEPVSDPPPPTVSPNSRPAVEDPSATSRSDAHGVVGRGTALPRRQRLRTGR